jgi:hypothetical protein
MEYKPRKRNFTETDGTVHPLYVGYTGDCPVEVLTLIRFKNGNITLQEAYTELMLCKLDLFKSNYLQIEKVGDLYSCIGADTLEEFNKMQDSITGDKE